MREIFGNNIRCPGFSTPLVPPLVTSGSNRGEEADYRQPFEELWWEAGPAVLHALDAAGNRLPRQTVIRLHNWISGITSANPLPALDLLALDRALSDLSTLHLSCYAYSLDPHGAAGLPPVDRLVMTDRGYAFAVSRAQLCATRLACALHGTAGAQTVLAAIDHERGRRRQIAERISALVEGAR
jgi:hypothetical protein